jgi:hypothetical protein
MWILSAIADACSGFIAYLREPDLFVGVFLTEP